MTGLSAAIGNVQLEKFESWSNARNNNAHIIADIIANTPILRTPMPENHIQHAWYRFYTFIRPENLADGWSRDRIIQEMSQKGFTIFSGSCSEIYREKLFTDRGLAPKQNLPIAKKLGDTSLAFLVDPTVEPEKMKALALCLKDVCKEATR
jgi:dTDP-4-amino-4,6-dideoxygalactose transaminase